MRRSVLGAVIVVAANFVIAQTPAESLIGTWIAQSNFCGESTVVVTSVEPDGIVRGTFSCKRTGWKPVMGDKIGKYNVKGTLVGSRFVMENVDGGGFDMTLEGTILKGQGKVRASSAGNTGTYTKQ